MILLGIYDKIAQIAEVVYVCVVEMLFNDVYISSEPCVKWSPIHSFKLLKAEVTWQASAQY